MILVIGVYTHMSIDKKLLHWPLYYDKITTTTIFY
jgi:hypothetical protein